MLKSAYYCYTDCYCYCCTRKKEFRHAQVTRPSMSADHRKTIPKTQVMRETRGPSAVHSAWASCSISIVRYVPPLLSLTTVHRVVSSRWAAQCSLDRCTHAPLQHSAENENPTLQRHLTEQMPGRVSVGLSRDLPFVYISCFFFAMLLELCSSSS